MARGRPQRREAPRPAPRREAPAPQEPLPLDEPPARAAARPGRPEPPQEPLPLDEPPARAAAARPVRPEPPQEPLPDAAAMVARLRRLREQRDGPAPAEAARRPRADGGAEPRFHGGDRIVCTPYGRGEVVASRVEDGREILVVNFDDHGELTIDAAVSAARPDEAAPPPPDDDF